MQHKPHCNLLKNATGSLYSHLPCNCGARVNEATVNELYEALELALEIINKYTYKEYIAGISVIEDTLNKFKIEE
ncbi:hypothetical protein GW796_09225 [archaeon]|nr:hypothetical protein [archaeon]NCT58909.1 hypothetical protein [archaeon]PJB16994.1 MAG: hypothetical protein CO117_13280 [Flavobacteriaceae bacterium CG_4_9_14_3_um_filter_33_16]